MSTRWRPPVVQELLDALTVSVEQGQGRVFTVEQVALIRAILNHYADKLEELTVCIEKLDDDFKIVPFGKELK